MNEAARYSQLSFRLAFAFGLIPQPQAFKAKPEHVIDDAMLQVIEASGFLEKLYGGR